MCDTFCGVGPAGTLFAKNSDRPPVEPQVIEQHEARPAGSKPRRMQHIEVDDGPAHAVVLSRPTWMAGAEHGVNEHGLAVGNERVYSRRDLTGAPALVGMDLVRLTLERARTADEGIDVLTSLLASYGQGGTCSATSDDPYDSSFLLADPRGGWVVETSGRDWAARRIEVGAAISNRYTLGSQWHRAADTVPAGTDVGRWHDPRVDTRLADHRLAVTSACAGDRPTPVEAVAALRDHGPGEPLPQSVGEDLSGVTVCMHVRGSLATTASMVADLATEASPRLWLCLGSPCVGVYVPTRVDSVPAVLGAEDRWRQAAALRDRVEADGPALAPIRGVLDPLEAELWQQADELHVRTDDPAAHAAMADGAASRVDDAVVSLLAAS